jgi:hypothetical protein
MSTDPVRSVLPLFPNVTVPPTVSFDPLLNTSPAFELAKVFPRVTDAQTAVEISTVTWSPDRITTASVEAGTPLGDQVEEELQLPVPAEVFVAAKLWAEPSKNTKRNILRDIPFTHEAAFLHVLCLPTFLKKT